jgi:putative cell wall-binding protein
VSLSKQTFSFAGTVVMAAADDPRAALAAGPLARQARAPLLLVPAGAPLPSAVKDEISRLKPATAMLVGAAGAFSDGVRTELSGLGVGTVRQLGGENPFATAGQVADQIMAGKAATAVLVSADDLPAGVVASTFAATERMPLLLTGKNALPPETLATLHRVGVTRTIVVGGASEIAEPVMRQLLGEAVGPVRVGGKTPLETAVDLADMATSSAPVPVPVNVAYLVSGRGDVGDALAAPAVVAYRGGVLLLADDDPTSAAFVRSHRASIDQLFLIGKGASFRADARKGGGSGAAVYGATTAAAAVVVIALAGALLARRRRAAARQAGQ